MGISVTKVLNNYNDLDKSKIKIKG